MALGPGKYDDLATSVRKTAKARGVIVIVIDGQLGSGFSVQADPQLTAALPLLLRDMAEKIAADMEVSDGR
jgi:hypothetical protein